jgi:hypothetical protein
MVLTKQYAWPLLLGAERIVAGLAVAVSRCPKEFGFDNQFNQFAQTSLGEARRTGHHGQGPHKELSFCRLQQTTGMKKGAHGAHFLQGIENVNQKVGGQE